jgi:hypothetical protein
MKSKLRLRWTILGCVWLATLAVTGWNLAKIDTVAAGRLANENLRREIHFQRHHAQRMEQVMASRQTLFMEVESLDLGMVALRHRLLALAAAFHIEDLTIDVETGENEDGRVACRLALAGGFEGTVGFLNALNEYAYLTPRQIQVSAVDEAHNVRLELSFFIQFKMIAPAVPAENPPEVTTQTLDAKGRPL